MGVFRRIKCPKCRRNYDIRQKTEKTRVCKCGYLLKIDKKNAIFYIDYYVQNNRMRKKIGTNKTLAENALRKKLLEIAENRFLDVRKQAKIRFGDFGEQFLEKYSKLHKKSWKSDFHNLKSLNKHLGRKYLYEIKQKDIENFKTERIKFVKPATVNRQLATLKTILNKAVEWDDLEESPAKKVKFFREDNHRLRYLEKEEIKKLLYHAPRRLKPLLILALHTGMRRGEMFGLKWRDVDFKRNIIYLLNTKNGEKREVPMNDLAKKALITVPKHPDSAYIFCDKDGKPYRDIRKSFFTTLEKAGIIDFKFHDLRHTYASQLTMAGVDLNTVRELLGHKDIRMTLRYAHLSPEHKHRAVEILVKQIGIDTHKTPKLEGGKLEKDEVPQPIAK